MDDMEYKIACLRKSYKEVVDEERRALIEIEEVMEFGRTCLHGTPEKAEAHTRKI